MRREDLAITAAKKQKEAAAVPPLSSLKCPLCKEYFQNPVTLPCLHSFCRHCLEKYNTHRVLNSLKHTDRKTLENGLSKDHGQSPNSFSSASFEEKMPETPLGDRYSNENISPEKLRNLPEVLSVHCPVCVELLGVKPPPENSNVVPFENARLARIVSLVSDSSEQDHDHEHGESFKSVLCQNCGEKTSEVKCYTCDALLCLDCKNVTHNARMFQNHDIRPLTHSEMLQLPMCDKPGHENNPLEFFSTQDEVGVCQVCLLKGDFVGKPYCMVNDVRAARQSEIVHGLDSAVELKGKLLMGKERILNTQKTLNTNLGKVENKVKENFARVRQAIEKKEQEVLAQLRTVCDKKNSLLSDQVQEIDLLVKFLDDGISNVSVILQHSNDLELVYLTVVLQEFVKDLNITDTQNFSFVKAAGKLKEYFAERVGPELKVKLSDQVEKLVQAYAPVEDDVQKFQQKLSKSKTEIRRHQTEASALRQNGNANNANLNELSKEQAAMLQVAQIQGVADDGGCVIQ